MSDEETVCMKMSKSIFLGYNLHGMSKPIFWEKFLNRLNFTQYANR